MERLRCKGCHEYMVKATGSLGQPMTERDLVLIFKMVGEPDPFTDYSCGVCGGSSFELVQVR